MRLPIEATPAPLERVQSPWTGWAGTAAVFLCHFALILGWVEWGGWAWEYRYWIILLLVAAVMAGLEAFVYRVHARHFDFNRGRALGLEAWRRIGARWAALCLLLAGIWGGYAVLEVYRADRFLSLYFGWSSWGRWPEFSPYFKLLLALTPLILLLSPAYFAMIERWGRPRPDSEDELLAAWGVFSRLPLVFVGRQGRREWLAAAGDFHFKNLLRSCLVKFFFVPLMFFWYLDASSAFDRQTTHFIRGLAGNYLELGPAVGAMELARRAFFALYESVFLLDLSLCVIGYLFTFRLFDTQVKSAEPTLLGWAAALACYPPFNRTLDAYLPYGGGGHPWMDLAAGRPWLWASWGAAILVLVWIYVWATVAFGLRFSNLTNRGILCHGPYAWVRHPAYISKNLSWWLVAAPFMRDWGDCLRLLGWNAVYTLRALTEEAHLSNDPHYREYVKKVPWRFIPGVW